LLTFKIYYLPFKYIEMKTLRYFFVMAIILIAGCAKDSGEFGNPEHELKRAKVPIPFKADCRAVPDMEIMGRLIISGTGTHVGKIDSAKSFYQITNIEFMIIDDQPYVALEGYARIAGANGDSFDINFWSSQSMTDWSFEGIAEVIPGSGTGKFKGCTGSFKSLGGEDVSEVFFTIVGHLNYE
jgi:hypothetical protein